MLTQVLLNSIFQIVLFSLIPLIWWLITARKQQGFFVWIGLKRVTVYDGFLPTFLLTILAFLLLSIGVQSLIRGIETANSQFQGLGFAGLPAAFVHSFLNTALSEEILFRGFLLKRLASRFGFTAGNAIQATLFGLMHGVFFIGIVGAFNAILIIAFTGAIGWYMGYLNEKKAGGSILPSWALHGFANLFSSFAALFSLL